MGGRGLNGDADYFGEQFDQISNRTGKQDLPASRWPPEAKPEPVAAKTPNGIPEREQNGFPTKSPLHIFVEGSSKGVPLQNGLRLDSESGTPLMAHDSSITISPPPQSSKPGRGRRTPKNAANDLFGSDIFAPGLPATSPLTTVCQPASVQTSSLELFNSTVPTAASITVLGRGLPTATSPTPAWGPQPSAFSHQPSGFSGSVLGVRPASFPPPLGFGAPSQVPPWNGPPTSLGAPVQPPAPDLWSQPARVSPPNAWVQPPSTGNPFQTNLFPPTLATQPPSMLSPLSSASPPPQLPPRTAPQKEPSKKESDAFTALDPLGDKEIKDVKEMFKDFQLTKPPAVPARRAEQQQQQQVPPKPVPWQSAVSPSKTAEGPFENPFKTDAFATSSQNAAPAQQSQPLALFGDPFGNPFA